MKDYLDILEVSPLGDGKTWILRDGFFYVYRDVSRGSEYQIDVPAKFMTDYASTPRFMWWIIKPWGKHGMAAVIHDWLYWEQRLPEWEEFQKRDAETIFHRCLIDSGVGAVKSFLMYLAVKWLGKGAWKGNQRKRASGWNRVAPRWPQKAFDTPNDLQDAE